MKFTIGTFNSETGQVPVVFKHENITHKRDVNAVLTDGKYDAAATRARVQEVANGVEHKIAAGALPEQG